jgi:hypothetical protein
MFMEVLIVKVEVGDDGTETLDWLRVAVRPVEGFAVRSIGPEKPSIPCAVKVDVHVWPACIVNSNGLGNTKKSGASTSTNTTVELAKEPLVPVIETRYDPCRVPIGALTVNVELPDGGILTLSGARIGRMPGV